MTNIAFLFGTIAGLIVIGVLIGTFSLASSDHLAGSEFLGYLVMIVALSLIFFGIKRYRDREGGGVIKFLPAFLLGVGIAAVAGVIYVVVWEVYLAATNYAFIDVYANQMIEAKRASGATAAEVEKVVAQLNWAKEVYANPPARMAMTFIEIFPVGLIIALISAAILRKSKVLPARASLVQT
jgi:hypothetical protein